MKNSQENKFTSEKKISFQYPKMNFLLKILYLDNAVYTYKLHKYVLRKK